MCIKKEDINPQAVAIFLEEQLNIKPQGEVTIHDYDEIDITVHVADGFDFCFYASNYFIWLQSRILKDS